MKIKAIYVVLGLPPSTLALIVRASAIVADVTTNKVMFPSPTPTMAVATGHIIDLQTAETVAQTRAKGTAAARDDKKKIVVADMRQLHTYVQQMVNASPEQAEAIANAAAMTLRKVAATHKSDLTVKHVVSGTVQLVAKAVQGGHAHEWEYSTDGGKVWTAVPASLAARTTITGLQTGVVTLFRHRAITKTGPQDWSQPITALVS